MGNRIYARAVYRVALFVPGFLIAATAAAAPGDLDTSFNAAGAQPGTLTTDLGSTTDHAYAVALQPDGRIVAGGTAQVGGVQRFALVRYTSAGALDDAFNAGGATPGVYTTDAAAFAGASEADALLVQPDGKIVAAGYTFDAAKAYNVPALIRVTGDGVLDSAGFNAGGASPGTATTDLGGAGQVNALALQPDGKVVAAGYAFDAAKTYNVLTLIRYDGDGGLDASFNAGGPLPGTARLDLGGDAQARAVALQTDGKIVVAGYAVNAATGKGDFVVARYNPDGTLDTTFNAGGARPGTVTTDLGGDDRANALVLQFDGGIVAAGTTDHNTGNNDFALARFTAAGALDTTFNAVGPQPGVVTTDFGDNGDVATALALQPDGMLLASGRVFPGGADVFAVARYLPDGSLDTGFNAGGTKPGTATVMVSSGFNNAYAMALQADGKIVVAGDTDNNANRYDFALARFIASTSWDLVPALFTFNDATDAVPGADQTSNVITVSGLGAGLTVPVAVSGGEYAKNGATVYTSGSGWAQNGDTFNVRHTASQLEGTITRTTLTVGGVVSANNTVVVVGAPLTETFSSTTDQGPTITGTPMPTTQSGTYYSFIPRASDPDSGDTLTFSITNKPGWARFNPTTGEMDGFPGADAVGVQSGIVITVTDAEGLSASLPTFSLSVTNTGDTGGIGVLDPLSLAAFAAVGGLWRIRRSRGCTGPPGR